VAIKEGKLLDVGSDGDGTEVVDLGGKFAMPGIVDLHVHPFATPLFNIMNLDFADPFDVDQMLKDPSEFAESNPDKTWIRAGSYGLGVFPD